MKNFEVVIAKDSKVQQWCIYDEKIYYETVPTTTAIISAFNEKRLFEKLDNLYKGFKIISVKEINIY